MKSFIHKLFETKKVMIAEPVIQVNQKLKTISFTGLIHLRKYEGTEPRFEGGEAKEIRALFTSIDANAQVLVKNHPTLELHREAAYGFSVTKRCADEKELEKSMDELKNAKMVEDYAMPLTRPSGWVL